MSSQDTKQQEQTAEQHNPMTSVQHDSRKGSGQLFNGIEQAKRHPGNDKAEATRASLADQSAPKGPLGSMLDSFRGSGTK